MYTFFQEKQFLCECGKRYAHKYSLEIHKSAKHAEYSKDCSTCGQVFRNPHTYRSHAKGCVLRNTHTCSRCPYTTAHKGNLNRHEKTHVRMTE